MCGRIQLDPREWELSDLPRDTIRQLRMFFAAPHYNAPPGSMIPAVRIGDDGKMEGAALKWGLIPSWADDPKIGYRMSNARAETVVGKRAFRSGFKQRRCLIVANGFYEWKTEGKKKQPFYIHRGDGRPFAFAGLWERWRRDGSAPVESCAVITTTANDLMGEVHDRMPVVIDAGDYDRWLDPKSKDAEAMLAPWKAERMALHAVTPKMGNSKDQEVDCTLPI